MLKRPDPAADVRVAQLTFHESNIVELRFADGREVVWSGRLAADLRAAIEVAVRHGFTRAQRGSSGINSIGN
jgi:hypothetical protein